MNDTIKYIGVALLAGLLVLGGFLVRGSTVIEKTIVEERAGALTGPDIPYPHFSFGGSRQFAGGKNFASGTTTVCAIQSPAATSSLTFASARFKTSSTTASIVTFAKAANAFATTTVLGNRITIAANAQDDIVATSTTANVVAENFIFEPNYWFVIGMEGGNGTFSPDGYCQARWSALTY